MSRIYPGFAEQVLQAGVNLASVNIRAVLIDLAQYTYSSTHAFLSDVPAGARASTSAVLASKTFTAGVFDTPDITFTAVPPGPAVGAVIFYVDTGTASTSRLIAYRSTGITPQSPAVWPITPNGADINLLIPGGIFNFAPQV